MSTIVTINSGDQISNSRANINTNFANLNADKVETSAIDTDTTLAANSDVKVPSQKAIKAYVDALSSGFASFVGCRVYQSSVTTLPGSGSDPILFQAENFDTDTMHSTSSNTSRITFTTAGKYMVGGSMLPAVAQSTAIEIRLNGTTILAQSSAVNFGPAGCSISTIYDFAQNDYIELMGYRNGGGDTSGDAKTNFWAYKIG